MLTPGQAHDLTCAEPLIDSANPEALLGDKAYDADAKRLLQHHLPTGDVARRRNDRPKKAATLRLMSPSVSPVPRCRSQDRHDDRFGLPARQATAMNRPGTCSDWRPCCQ